MWAELRHEYDDRWGLAFGSVRDGQRVPHFGEGIQAPPGREREAATERLAVAGRAVISKWRQVQGGWDADVS